jgi:hypothetical protein
MRREKKGEKKRKKKEKKERRAKTTANQSLSAGHTTTACAHGYTTERVSGWIVESAALGLWCVICNSGADGGGGGSCGVIVVVACVAVVGAVEEGAGLGVMTCSQPADSLVSDRGKRRRRCEGTQTPARLARPKTLQL